MKRRLLVIDSLRIACRDTGSGGPPILFVHGNSNSSAVFRKQFRGPLAEHHRLVAIDLPGHGDSSRAANPDATYTLPGYARVVVSVVERLGLRNAVCVGCSLGGHILLEASAQLPQVRGYLMYGTPPFDFPPAFDRAYLPHPSTTHAFEPRLTARQVRSFITAQFAPRYPVPELYFDAYHRTDPLARSSLFTSVGKNEYADEIAIVGALSVPLAILHGEHEAFTNPSYYGTVRMPTLWRSAVQHIPDAGHSPHWETPRSFNALVGAFARDCMSAARSKAARK